MLSGGPAKQDAQEAELHVLFPTCSSSSPSAAAMSSSKSSARYCCSRFAVLWGWLGKGNVICHLTGGVKSRSWWVKKMGRVGKGWWDLHGNWEGLESNMGFHGKYWRARPVRMGTGRNMKCEGEEKKAGEPVWGKGEIRERDICEREKKGYKWKEEVWKGKEIEKKIFF